MDQRWRRFVDGQKAAAQASRRAARPMSPADSLRAAFELWALAGDALAFPDPVRDREVAVARAAWDRLRAGLR